ncbi:hypothetical protein OG413_44605 [Streptomyces sp. NBC_01433]|uniref:hypothetical protein n=1 Tax=Streptomyces sp. NBC_01433 TaxID=2903864 RepID=UPI0022570514|nr:hypothetical protein [Streptomyces sp. NBC_01433]MCX4682267.1 hypothetical protein [Streptomyces sp. NBC_01433]
MTMSRADGRTNRSVEFLHVTAETVALRDLRWFCDHWSRDSSYSRWRRLPPASLLILESGKNYPELFTVSGGQRGHFGYRDGRRFVRCHGVIIPASTCPDETLTNYPFEYWEHEPMEDELPVDDVESVRFPLPEEPAPVQHTQPNSIA